MNIIIYFACMAVFIIILPSLLEAGAGLALWLEDKWKNWKERR